MTKYTISDLHLDHGNIIEYCDRPFDTAEEMNEVLVQNWNDVVDPDDTVYFLGDLAVWGPEAAEKWAPELNGNVLLISGNHDDFNDATLPYPVVESAIIKHRGIKFGLVHWPDNDSTPNPDGEWLIYGHHHNNDIAEFPFFDPQRNRVNVSVELIGYEPVSLDRIVDVIKEGRRLEVLPEDED